MTDDDKALVERPEEWEWTLRAVYKAGDLGTDEPAIVMGEAADRIEALSAENERLRMHLDVALETLAEEGVCGDECNTCKEARAALGETK